MGEGECPFHGPSLLAFVCKAGPRPFPPKAQALSSVRGPSSASQSGRLSLSGFEGKCLPFSDEKLGAGWAKTGGLCTALRLAGGWDGRGVLPFAFPSLGMKGKRGFFVFPKPPWSGGCLRLNLMCSPMSGEEKPLRLECPIPHDFHPAPSSRGCLFSQESK